MYHGYIQESLRPGDILYSPYDASKDQVVVTPYFYVPELPKIHSERTPPRRILKQARDASKYFTPIEDANGAMLTLPELLEFKRYYADESETFGDDDELWLPLEIKVEYTDVNGANEFATPAADFERIYVPAGGGDIDALLDAGQRSKMILEHPINRFKRKYFSWTRRLDFEENLETEVKPKSKTEDESPRR